MCPPTQLCRAAVFNEVGRPLSINDVHVPELNSGELLVRITCCTLCGSDIHTYAGDRPGPTPSILGHEIIGIVEDVLDENALTVDDQPIRRGDRITWSVAASCDSCHRCENDIPQKCVSLFKYGHEPLTEAGPNGGLAEYCVLKKGTAVVILPDGLSDNVACPANCATATVAAAVRTAGSLQGKRVLVLGAGMLGLTATAFASAMGAAHVCVCDLNESRLSRAKHFGANEWNPSPSSKFDIVFELSGSPAAVELGINCADIGGRIVLVGSVSPSRDVSVDPEHIVRQLISIHGVHNYQPQDLVTAVGFLEEFHNKFPFAELVEKTFTLEQAEEAFQYALKNRPIRVAVVP